MVLPLGEQLCEAASWQATAKVDVKEPPTITCVVEEDDLADTREDPSSEEPIPEIVLLVDIEDPDAPTWTEALQSSDHDKWIEGVEAKLTGLRDMGVYALVPHSEVPTNCSVLHGQFVCRLKHDEIGNPVCFKVHWVAKGFQQVWGRDFSKTTSPTAQLESLHIVLHMAATLNWHLEQYDVKTAFLNGILLEEEVQYMEQPPRFAQPGLESHVETSPQTLQDASILMDLEPGSSLFLLKLGFLVIRVQMVHVHLPFRQWGCLYCRCTHG